MRTTLTLDDDVAAMLRRLQKEQGTSFKQLVNDALRRGGESLSENKPPEWKQYTFPVRSGPFTVPIDDISAVEEMLDEEKYKNLFGAKSAGSKAGNEE
jgi:hypothetical protein